MDDERARAPLAALRDGVRTLYPGYFALVMATGIVSIALSDLTQTLLSAVLMWVAAAAYAALVLLLGWRAVAFRADLAAESLRGRVDAPRYVAGVWRRIVTATAPLRARPAPDAGYETEALLGERVRVFDEEEGWAWGQLEADDYVGYMPAAMLESTACFTFAI